MKRSLHLAALFLVAMSVPGIEQAHAADLPIKAGASAEFFRSRGISFYAPFDGTVHAVYAAGRAEAIEPYFEEFYKDQSITYEEGPFGSAVTGDLCLVYDPLRNFSAERGAVSFWFRPRDGDLWTFFQVHAREAGVGPNSRRQMDLYYATFLLGTSPALRQGLARALIRPVLEAQDEPFILPDMDPNTWHHIVWTWDHTQGMRLFIDGEKLVDSWGTTTWVQMMTPGIIKLKSMQAVDELLFFDRALTTREALALYRGQLPEPATAAADEAQSIPPALEIDIAHAYGLDAGGDYPVLRASRPMTITALHAVDARDARQPMWRALDGNRSTCWPTSHIEIANSDRLDIDYGGPVRANYLRVLSDGPRFSVVTGAGQPLWTDEVRVERDGWEDKLVRRRMLAEPAEFEKLVLNRHGARVGEFWAYDIRDGALQTTGTQRLLQPETVGALRDLAWEGGVYSLYHSGRSPVIEMTEGSTGVTNDMKLVPLSPFHLVTELMDERTGITGLRLRLALSPPENRTEAIFRIRIVDPVTKERDLFNTDVKVEFDGSATEPELFDLSIDLRDIVLEKDRRLWVWITPRHASALKLARCDLTLHQVPVDEAAREFVADARDLVERAYPFDSEPHPWTRSWKWPGDEHFYYLWSEWAPLSHLMRTGLGADDPVLGTYWHVMRPDTRDRLADYVDYSRSAELRALPYTRPALRQIDNPTHAPQWALYQRELLGLYLGIVQWWHDHRLDDETGILRGYGDDTQLTGETFWLYFCTGDEKIRHLLRAVTDGTWANAGFYHGYPMRTNDVGHNAEEVVGAWPLLVLSEYGDPQYVEMSMESMSVLDLATTRTKLGHRHFKSWYFSATEAVTEGDLGVDNLGNSAYTILGHMLSWYNGHPKLTSFYRDWADAWLDDFARSREQGFTKAISVRIPSEEYVEGVYHRSYTMPHQFFITGLLTGDSTYTARALSNDDGFYPVYRRTAGPGMLLRDFAFERYRLREDSRYASYNEHPATPFEQWFANGDTDPLGRYYQQRVETYRQGTEYLYTQGQPSTDRLWGLWDENLFLAYLGGYAAGHRRTSNWPGLAISYTDAGTDLASLVLVNQTTRLALRVYNFEPSRTEAEIRLWQLAPGLYQVETGSDADEDGEFDGDSKTRQIDVRRGSTVAVSTPYGHMQLIRVTLIEARPEPSLLPDLAIGRRDVTYASAGDVGALQVTVHNIGSRTAGPAVVRVLDRRDRVLAQAEVQSLAAPLDLKPRVQTLSLPMSEKDWQRARRVEVLSHDSALEITQDNNVLSLE